jgi:hypothetical protein
MLNKSQEHVLLLPKVLKIGIVCHSLSLMRRQQTLKNRVDQWTDMKIEQLKLPAYHTQVLQQPHNWRTIISAVVNDVFGFQSFLIVTYKKESLYLAT